MPRFTDHFLQRLREQTDIVEVVSRHVQLKKSGGDFVGICPFHHGKAKSFSVSPRKKIFHCFGCEKGGDVVKFIAEIKGIDFPAAVLEVAAMAGLTPEYEAPVPKYYPAPSAPAPDPAPAPTPTAQSPATTEGELTEDFIAQCIECVRHEAKASVGLIQRRFMVGYAKAARIMDLLEARGIVGPARGAGPREVVGVKPPSAPDLAEGVAGVAEVAGGEVSPFEEPVVDLPPESPVPGDGSVSPTEHSEPSWGSAVGAPAVVPAANASGSAAAAVPEQPVSPGTAVPGPDGLLPLPEDPTWVFYQSLPPLSAADRAELRRKRGLSDRMIEEAGLRSNDQGNKALLLGLEAKFGVPKLIKYGLWRQWDKRSKEKKFAPRPTGQFFGWGVVGKNPNAKKKDDLEEGEDYDDIDTGEFLWDHKSTGKCNPILIPYWRDRTDGTEATNEQRKLVGLRPHKGFPKGQKPRLYIAQTVRGGRAVICEGEFKALAVADVCTDWSVASLPGITMCKNFHVWADIVAWLSEANAREVVIAFDNEEKGDPKLPGYKEQLEKRFDAQVWARVLAVRLEREGCRVRIATLPDDWRNEKGKADWDSALALLRVEKQMSDELIRQAFESVLGAGLQFWEFKQAKMFAPVAEGIIADLAELYSYEPGLPWGGKGEKRLAKELRELAKKLWSAKDADDQPLNVSARLLVLAEALEQTWGWYYVRKITENAKEKLLGLRRRTVGSEQLAAVDALLAGTPTNIAPFRMMPYYVLLKPNGSRDRLVRLVNIRREDSGLVALPSNDLTAPRDWRRWLSEQGNFGWEGGERELQTLQRDMNYKLARRTVKQLVCYGAERPDALWFFDDCALGDGVVVSPDEEGIFWHDRIGHTFLRNAHSTPAGKPVGDEGQEFRVMDFARMHPGLGLQLGKNGEGYRLAKGEDDPAALLDLTGNLAARLRESFATTAEGGSDGLLLLAAFVAMAAGPDVYSERGEFPGIWIVGEKGSGKTVAAKVCMALWGYEKLDQPMSFKSSTTVNATLALGQSANIWAWGDEYKEGQIKEEAIKNIVHCGFNREIPGKWSPDGTTRKIRTNFIVTGESMCANAATMDRFLTVVAAKENWQGTQEQKHERFAWLLSHRPFFFAIVRAILRQRSKFVETVTAVLGEWERLPVLAAAEPRGKFSHGMVWASLSALLRLIPFMTRAEAEKFQGWLIERTLSASREVQQMVNVNQFWADLMACVTAGGFGDTLGDLRKLFKAREMKGVEVELSERQRKAAVAHANLAVKTYYLYLKPGVVIDMLRAHLRKQGRTLPLDTQDLRKQMESRAWWVKPPSYSSMHKQQFGGASAENCWCIDVSKLPEIGLREVSDEEFDASLYVEGQQDGDWLIPADWVDPRKGDLFYLIDKLTKKEAAAGKDE